jgi:hypothetical protein
MLKAQEYPYGTGCSKMLQLIAGVVGGVFAAFIHYVWPL